MDVTIWVLSADLFVFILQAATALDETSPSSAESFEMLDLDLAQSTYEPVQPHWFYCRRGNEKDWLPFSIEDSLKLEDALKNGERTHICLFQLFCNTLTCLQWNVSVNKAATPPFLPVQLLVIELKCTGAVFLRTVAVGCLLLTTSQ